MASLPGLESRGAQEMIRHLKWSHAEKQRSSAGDDSVDNIIGFKVLVQGIEAGYHCR